MYICRFLFQLSTSSSSMSVSSSRLLPTITAFPVSKKIKTANALRVMDCIPESEIREILQLNKHQETRCLRGNDKNITTSTTKVADSFLKYAKKASTDISDTISSTIYEKESEFLEKLETENKLGLLIYKYNFKYVYI